ncbi:SDR family oxidoreductase [Rhizorhabdus argentea]|uniref:SDR family oxidoreductase n=1 Tax=Rhizorhabdus argentea TaxID=1387174 RepID=UPI0030ED531C
MSLWVKREAVKAEWAGKGILLNAVAPGVVQTPMIRYLLDTKDRTEFLNKNKPVRLGRPAKPAELAALIAFLSSRETASLWARRSAATVARKR